jgi:hypothetical protein
LLGKKGHGNEKAKRGSPRFQKLEGFDGKANVAAVNSIVVVHDGQRPQQQQEQDDIGLRYETDMIIDQKPRNAGHRNTIETSLNNDTGTASSLENGTGTVGLKYHI